MGKDDKQLFLLKKRSGGITVMMNKEMEAFLEANPDKTAMLIKAGFPRPRLLGEAMEPVGDPDLAFMDDPEMMIGRGILEMIKDMPKEAFLVPTLTMDDFKKRWEDMQKPLDWPNPHPFYGHISMRGKDGMAKDTEAHSLQLAQYIKSGIVKPPKAGKSKPKQKNKFGFLDGLGYKKHR